MANQENHVRFPSEIVDREQHSVRRSSRRSTVRRQTVEESPLSKFEEGQQLPGTFLETIPYSSYGTPLAENDETFVVIGRELSFSLSDGSKKCGKLFRFSNKPSFYLFSPGHFVRRLALYCFTHPVFECLILLTIISNAVYMSIESDCAVTEYTFLAIYSVEAVVKWLARGVAYHKHTYLTDPWNWLDLLVLLSSYAALAVQVTGASLGGLNLQPLRTFRLLRMVTILPGLQAIVKTLLVAFRKLVHVLAFVAFFLMVFALFGMELFSGDLRNKCVAIIYSTATNLTWNEWTADSNNWALDNIGNYMICGNVSGAQRCPSGYKCLLVASSDNPLSGYLSFDEFLMALIAVFIVVTGDYWEEEFRVVLSSNGPWSSLYFIFVVVFGAFYLMNLILSVVALSYTPEDEAENEAKSDSCTENIMTASPVDVTTSHDDGLETTDIDDRSSEQTRDSLRRTAAGMSDLPREAFTMSSGNESRQARKCDCKFRSGVNRLRLEVRNVVDSSKFDAFITVIIVINTLAMAVVHHGMPKLLLDITDIINEICAVIFAIEAALKIVALGREYFKNKWNLLDFFVVIGSIFDAGSTYFFHSTTSLNTTAIRLLRLLRILKLAQSWRTMRLLLEIIFHAITSLGNLTVIMACIVFIFALIGMQLFNGTYTTAIFGENLPRWNFDGLMRSLLTVFRILCRDAVEPMVSCFRANGMAMCMPVFLGSLIVGTFVVLNLFLALLLMAFSSDDLKSSSSKDDLDDEQADNNRTSLITRIRKFFEACRGGGQLANNARQSVRATIVKTAFFSARQRAKMICEHKAFEIAVLVLIFVSSVLLCLNDVYLQEGSTLDVALSTLDNIFLALFTAEFLIKLFAYGFKACFTQFWTILDFIVIATGFIDVGISQTSNSKSNNLLALRCLRCIRCLRPLRAISRWDGMRIVVNALVRTIPGIGNVLLVVVVFWLVFSIVGVQFFAGKFARCIDIASGNRMPLSLITTRAACENFPNFPNATRRWMNPTINFDNVFSGYLALLQVATFESWTDILEAAVDVPDNVDEQPSRERSFNFSLYFVIFIIFGSFFLLNLFIGVIVDTFNQLKKEMEVSAVEVLLTDSQRAYFNMVKKIGKRKPRRLVPKPKSKWLAVWFRLASSPIFETAMACVIVASCVTMATEHFNQPAIFTQVQEYLNMVFTAIFTAEAAVKIIGLRIHYFREAWNVFDFTLVVWSLAMLTFDEDSVVKSMRTSSLLRALRVLRVGRLIRLVRSMSSVRALIFSLLSSLPALFNVGCLLSLIIFIYAICGMILFGHIRHNGVINDVVNFETFGNSFLLLFRICTLAGWDGVLTAMSIQPANIERGGCDPATWRNPITGVRTPTLGGDCGSPILAALYLSSFIVFSNFVLTNIFVAIILENLEAATQSSSEMSQNNDENATTVTDDDIDAFFASWAVFDPLATQYIQLADLSNLLEHLPPPFHFKKPNSSVIALLDVPILDDGLTGEELVHCGDVLLALVHHRSSGLLPFSSTTADNSQQQSRKSILAEDAQSHYLVEDALECAFLATQLEKQMLGNWKTTVAKNANMRITTTMGRRREEASAILIQRTWRKHCQQKADEKIYFV